MLFRSNTLSWIHKLVQPIMDDVLNEGNNDTSHAKTEMYTAIATTTLDDQFYLNKYLQIMVLINYHVLDIIDTLNFPDEQFEYHCTMMHEILSFISYLEVFYPMTSSNNNNHLSNDNIGDGNTGGSGAPAA